MDGPEKRREIGNIENSVAPIVDTGCLMHIQGGTQQKAATGGAIADRGARLCLKNDFPPHWPYS